MQLRTHLYRLIFTTVRAAVMRGHNGSSHEPMYRKAQRRRSLPGLGHGADGPASLSSARGRRKRSRSTQ